MKRREPHFERSNAVDLRKSNGTMKHQMKIKQKIHSCMDIHSELNPLTVHFLVHKKTSDKRTTSLQGTNGRSKCVPFVLRFYYTKVLLLGYVHYAINKYLVRVDVQCFLWPVYQFYLNLFNNLHLGM